MNSTFIPIPPTMPLLDAANLMVRRGEAPDFGRALGLLRRRRRKRNRTLFAADVAARVTCVSPRLPYRDD